MTIKLTARYIRCPYPDCGVQLPLRDDRNYVVDYAVIEHHSKEHDPPVRGPWLKGEGGKVVTTICEHCGYEQQTVIPWKMIPLCGGCHRAMTSTPEDLK